MFVEKQRLCFNCLGEGHSANQCRCQISCHVCQRRHHTFLHSDRDISSKLAACSDSTEETEPGEEVPVVNFTSGGVASNKQVLVATALVKAETENGGTRVVRALLDQGAQASFVTEAAVQHLGLKKTPVKLFMSGVGGVHKVAITATVNLSILSMRNGFQNSKLTLKVYVLKSITTSLPSKRIMTSNWVSSLPLADPQYNKPSKIDLLLGAEVVGQIMREGIQKQGSLLAQNTTLGWILSGVAESNSNKQAMNLIAMHQVCFGEQNQLNKQCEQEADVKTEVDSKQGDRSKLKTDDVRVVAYRKSVNRLNRRKKRKKNIEQSFLITQVLTKTVEECYKKYQRIQSRKIDKPREKWEWNIYKLKGSFKSNA